MTINIWKIIIVIVLVLGLGEARAQSNKLITDKRLVELFVRYANDCYVDSTGYITHHGISVCWIKKDMNNTCCEPSHWWYEMHHRTPTFEGFVEWLRKQRGK
jgi:hypothetical protein